MVSRLGAGFLVRCTEPGTVRAIDATSKGSLWSGVELEQG